MCVAATVAVEVLTVVFAVVLAEILSGTELEVLLVAVRCWDSLESYTFFGAQSLVESICALLLR